MAAVRIHLYFALPFTFQLDSSIIFCLHNWVHNDLILLTRFSSGPCLCRYVLNPSRKGLHCSLSLETAKKGTGLGERYKTFSV